ncbi:unnamed protein product [Blepharisma stoltei]|uniref:Calcineurin-like phosphoesterase domain-containing protein n=1 Tax=Blepharisma stoltei TaxID=1481888 RepID=A0AAU9ILB5_9CILI|nr:unnamed protein product [Blepharisma stoltei]
MESTHIEVHNGSILKKANHVRFVCISDTHDYTDNLILPDGDVLIHAGDFTLEGNYMEVAKFNHFLSKQKHKYKIVIAGNHDFSFDSNKYNELLQLHELPYQASSKEIKSLLKNCIYLEDSYVRIYGYKIYGSPWTKEHYPGAFTIASSSEIQRKWMMIPDNTDILVTHSPSYMTLDLTIKYHNAGCQYLAEELLRVRPKVHIFGHIHESSGWIENRGITSINAAVCNRRYQPNNPAKIFDLPRLG